MHMDGNGEMQRAWLAIHQLVSDFAYSIDMENGERTAELFTEDGWYESDDRRSTGRAAIREAYRRRAARGPRTSRHIFTNLRIERLEDNAYRGTALLLLFAEDGHPPAPANPLLVADVHDVYVLNGATARLRSRRLHSIFAAESSVPVLPLGDT
jgi:SnoaL-like domain